MSFLNPALLAFTAAIAVPILIHLLNRRRFRQVRWAAMRFLRASIEKNRRRMELEDLILLALRCLVVFLLALALARPAIRAASAFFANGTSAAVIVLDRSASLGAGEGAPSRFEQALAAADAAVDSFSAGSAIGVIFGGDRVEEPVAEPTQDRNLVRKVLREAQATDLGTDHAVSLARALELLETQTALRKEVVLVTDDTARGWHRLPEITSILADAGHDTRLRVVLVGNPVDENLAVTALGRSGGFASSKEPLRVRAEITNLGRSPMDHVRATLHVNGGPATDEAVLERLEPGETRGLTFFGRLDRPGYHALEVRLAPDRMPADDARTMVVRAVDIVRVLVVRGDPEANSAFFLRHALQPVPPSYASEYYLQPQVIPTGQLALTRLADYEAVILADVASLSAPALESLSRYVREGGALIWFPGPSAQPPFYNGELAPRGLVPAELHEVNGDPTLEEGEIRLESGPYQHPVFALWNEAGSGTLTSIRFRAAWDVSPVAARTNAAGTSGAGMVMVRFADGSPAAVEADVGRGRTILFASTAGTAWNDMAVRSAFVPLLHRLLGRAGEAQDADLNVRVGSRVTLELPGEAPGADVAVIAPGDQERRLIRTLRAGPAGALLEFDETEQAGGYRVTPLHEARPLAVFATQMDPLESDLTPMTPETREELSRVAQVIDYTAGDDLRAAFERERVGAELWLPLVIGVLLLGLVETFLAQWFSRPK